jgi:hypothetical protein
MVPVSNFQTSRENQLTNFKPAKMEFELVIDSTHKKSYEVS